MGGLTVIDPSMRANLIRTIRRKMAHLGRSKRTAKRVALPPEHRTWLDRAATTVTTAEIMVTRITMGTVTEIVKASMAVQMIMGVVPAIAARMGIAEAMVRTTVVVINRY
jgi:hypothetical protein